MKLLTSIVTPSTVAHRCHRPRPGRRRRSRRRLADHQQGHPGQDDPRRRPAQERRQDPEGQGRHAADHRPEQEGPGRHQQAWPGRQGRQGRRPVEAQGPRDPARAPSRSAWPTLEAQDASGVNTNWVAGHGLDRSSTLTRSGLVLAAGNTDGTLGRDPEPACAVQATKTVSFTYKLENGAAYTGGRPARLHRDRRHLLRHVRRRSCRPRHRQRRRHLHQDLDHPGQRSRRQRRRRLRQQRSPARSP